MYPPSWQAQPPFPPPQQQEKDKDSNKDTEMMKLKLEKLEEERKRRELAVELERQKMEEKFERLKEEHEETLMKHEVAVMNAKAKSADIVEDAAKLLREEQKKNQLYRTEMQQMEKRLREEKSNMAAIQSSTKTDTVVYSNTPQDTESGAPKLLKSTSPKVNKYRCN